MPSRRWPAGAGEAADTQPADRYQRSNRVLVPELETGVTLRGPEAHHLRDVLRLKPGAAIEAFDGRGRQALGRIAALDGHGVTLELGPAVPSAAEPAIQLTLAVALLKGDKLAEVVRPATELGVVRFQLLKTVHADRAELSPARLARLRRVAQEAARQCGRAVVPAVAEPVDLGRLLESAGGLGPFDLIIVADPRAAGRIGDAQAALHEAVGTGRAPSVVIVTGPEGGLSGDEVDALAAAGALTIGLGPRILRAETAPVALAAAVLLGAGG